MFTFCFLFLVFFAFELFFVCAILFYLRKLGRGHGGEMEEGMEGGKKIDLKLMIPA